MNIDAVGSNNYVNNSVSEAKSKVSQDNFEKRLQNAVDKNDNKELKKVCKDFEGILLKMMYKEMKATVPKSELLQEDSGKEIFESMLDDELMDNASKNGIGLGDVLYKQLGKHLGGSGAQKKNDK